MAVVSLASTPIFRADYGYSDHGYSYSYFEKRQAFLRSYHFSRKQGFSERVRVTLARTKRLVWVKLGSARRLRRTLWLRLRCAIFGRGRFNLLMNPANSPTASSTSCW